MTGQEVDEQIQAPPAYELVLERLRRSIHLGEFLPGDKLPPERDHSARLGISRVTLREAIRILEGEGYIETRRGSKGGAVVLPRQGSSELARQVLRERLAEIEGVLDFRLANERCAAERAATRVGAEDLKYLEESVEALRASDSLDRLRRGDSEFHLRIAEVADCELLRQAVEDGRAAMFLPIDALDFDCVLGPTIREHQRILNALRDRDAPRAGRAMADHLRTTLAEVRAGAA